MDETLGESDAGEEDSLNFLDSISPEETQLSSGLNEQSLDFWAKKAEVWVIDCHPLFFENVDSEEAACTWWQEILEAAAEQMKRYVISQPTNKLCILLYNTKYYLNDMGIPGIYTLLTLEGITAKRIQKVLMDSKLTFHEFTKRFGGLAEDPPSLADIFWIVNQILWKYSNPKKYRYHNTVLLFTGCDSPCATTQQKITAIERARDLQKNLAEISLLPLDLCGSTFDISKFYIDILRIDPEDSETYKEISKIKMKSFKEKIRRKQFNQRVATSQLLHLAPDFSVSILVYYSIIRQQIPSAINLHPADHSIITTKTAWCTQDKVPLKPEQIRYKMNFAEKEVIFTEEEKKEIFDIKEPGMTLIGFVPIKEIKMKNSISHSYFVYPDETNISGSSVFMSALQQKMILMEKAAIVEWVPRRGPHIYNAALLAQVETLDEYGEQLTPPGFNLIRLPFAEEIRRVVDPWKNMTDLTMQTKEMEEEQVNLAKKVLEGLMVPSFHPNEIENPALQHHYTIIEAMALDLEKPAEVKNQLRPSEDKFLAIKEDILAWKESVYGTRDEEAMPGISIPMKRKSGAIKEEANDTPRSTKISFPKYISDEDIMRCFKEDNLDKLSVPQLKSWLQQNALQVSGRKVDLIDRVEMVLKKDKTEFF
ncbi:hypothetical protein IE077_000238 [Cardiosporidium cionae]|uniref:SAP domain-containing protein n=1 Tax=Cardiosporidium cionae TaxID=476202 RepID=A0ABQ7JC94_9APIC|nr:hypothetical protein IE077_000238 [Cardiosporidium cionae]|eukprot:KAF8821596.1 hypothetical protein IE077_000238 [Cardiosporidium cionae]